MDIVVELFFLLGGNGMRRDDPLVLCLRLYGEDKLSENDEKSAIKKLNNRFRLHGRFYDNWNDISCFNDMLNRYLNLVEQKKPGNTFDQKRILELTASVASPASVPFWSQLLELNRPRDSFSNTRRMYALAALAYIAIRSDELGAMETLKAACGHPRPETRAMAAHYIRCVHVGTDQPLLEDVASILIQLATKDRSFAPRFMARRALAATGQTVPIDNPNGVYAFKIWHEWEPSVFRVIELESRRTLGDLHRAIQDTWNWGDDHLYAFYLNGKRYDSLYEFGHDYMEGAAAFADDAKIGELGLKPRHKFLYYFDLGDSHQFWVVVSKIREEAGSGPFPRVVESVGETMEQYPRWE